MYSGSIALYPDKFHEKKRLLPLYAGIISGRTGNVNGFFLFDYVLTSTTFFLFMLT